MNIDKHIIPTISFSSRQHDSAVTGTIVSQLLGSNWSMGSFCEQFACSPCAVRVFTGFTGFLMQHRRNTVIFVPHDYLATCPGPFTLSSCDKTAVQFSLYKQTDVYLAVYLACCQEGGHLQAADDTSVSLC